MEIEKTETRAEKETKKKEKENRKTTEIKKGVAITMDGWVDGCDGMSGMGRMDTKEEENRDTQYHEPLHHEHH